MGVENNLYYYKLLGGDINFIFGFKGGKLFGKLVQLLVIGM